MSEATYKGSINLVDLVTSLTDKDTYTDYEELFVGEEDEWVDWIKDEIRSYSSDDYHNDLKDLTFFFVSHNTMYWGPEGQTREVIKEQVRTVLGCLHHVTSSGRHIVRSGIDW